MAVRLTVTGQVQAIPSPTGASGMSASIDLAAAGQYTAQDSGSFAVNAPVTPLLINPGGIASIRFIAIRSLDGTSLVALLSSSSGTDQAAPFSDQLLLHVPKPADPYTAVKVKGTGVIEYVIAGD